MDTPSVPLTDVTVRTAKPADKAYKLSDGGGLYLFVTKSGGKLWRLKYRHHGKERLVSYGAYPAVSLADARALRDESRKVLSAGEDASTAKKEKRRLEKLAANQTFGLVAKEYLAKQKAEGHAISTTVKNTWLLEDLAAPLAGRPIAQIRPPEVLELLRQIEARGTYESALRLRSAIGRVMRYAVATGRADDDPTAALKGALQAVQVRHRAAITKSGEVGQLMRAIDGLEGTAVVKAALKIMALCFPRPGELRYAQWSEIDLNEAIWAIPEERTKMRRAHSIALAPQAVEVFRDLQKITGNRALAFPGVRNPKVPLSENTLNAALRRLGYTADEMTAHGFRTIASTLLNESGLWNPDAIERALAHQDANAVRRAYARGEYWEERVRMAAWWADHLDALRCARSS